MDNITHSKRPRNDVEDEEQPKKRLRLKKNSALIDQKYTFGIIRHFSEDPNHPFAILRHLLDKAVPNWKPSKAAKIGPVQYGVLLGTQTMVTYSRLKKCLRPEICSLYQKGKLYDIDA
jgi:hypothetical protein